jgi:crossover junction endodeoxyribonuclease RuvC
MGISVRDFEQMQDRASRVRPVPTPAAESRTSAPRDARNQVILGIDPSLRSTGYGVIRNVRPQPVALDHGAIRCPAGWDRSRCLVRIHEVLSDVIRAHQPRICAVEGLFFAQNLQTALIMGEARGAALVAVAQAGLEIYEIAPRKVKQAIVGYGAAQKLAVARMVQRMLSLPDPPGPDAADALALALTHAQESRGYRLGLPRRL